MVPDRRATMTAPESRAVMYSMPVPTNGARAWSSGTAWRCMFDPMSARFASSFSRNGMSEAATETSCFGDTRSLLVDLDVRLRDDVLIFLPRREVEAVGLEFDTLLLRASVRADELV